MIGALRHRGPDGSGYLEDGPVGLAHARLAIIDLVSGDQPIRNEDGSVRVVFNGEIFNYVELRAELERAGHRFYTHSDTEVLVHLYEEHGLDFVHRLRGQFAVALWDRARRRLVLARDRAGIRPLFYVQHGDRVYFASEAKALFANGTIPRRLDSLGLAQVFTFWSALAPRTVFAGIASLGAGEMLVIENGASRVERWWDWRYPVEPVEVADEPALAEELRALLVESVRMQLRADVPVGAYLSGGLDSSLVAGIVGQFGDAELRTFSLTFEDPEFDESDHQREMCSYLGTSHTSVACRSADIAAGFPRVIWHAETPLLRTAAAPLMMLSAAVRDAGYKVVLTGEGADEVFAGYDLFKEAKVRRFWARYPQSRFRPRIFERLYPYLRNSPAQGGALTRRYFADGLSSAEETTFAHATRWQTTQRAWQFFSKALRAELGDADPIRDFRERIPADIVAGAPLARDQYVEARTLLANYLLCSQGDRMAMANSVEGRFPFLDERLVDFAGRLPPHLKIRGLTEKYLLKKAARGLVPESVWRRTKQPYRAPDSPAFFAPGTPNDYVFDLLSEARLRDVGLFEPAAVARLVAKCRAGRAIGFADNMAFVGILSTMLLHEQFVRGAAPESKPLGEVHDAVA